MAKRKIPLRGVCGEGRLLEYAYSIEGFFSSFRDAIYMSRTATIGFEPMTPSSRLRQGFKLTHKLRPLNDGLPPLPVYGLGADLIPLARLEQDRTPYERG